MAAKCIAFHSYKGGTGKTTITKETKMDIISEIPCYCDIQFSRKEFLTVLQYPDHPISKQHETLASIEEIKV